ncbi:MAG TPA: hypothetical protein VGH47_10805, partial [Xanthobacteraceae bacterium]
MTLREYLDIMADLDGYIAKGGQLLDLELHDPSQMPPAVHALYVDRLGSELCARLGRFFVCVSQLQ